MAHRQKDLPQACFEEYMDLQQHELSKIVSAQTLNLTNDNAQLKQLIDNILGGYGDYVEKRSSLAPQNALAYFAPTWCTTLEKSLMWIGGCLPSSYVRLVYALCGLDIESQLARFLDGDAPDFGELSSQQFLKIEELHKKTTVKEDKLSGLKASLQAEMSDSPIVEVLSKYKEPCELNGQVNIVLQKNQEDMACLLKEADALRLETLKEIISILTPLQGLQFFAHEKKLCLSIRNWGLQQDNANHASSSQNGYI
ncbi:protein DOG1-like 1 [Apium graveolens]|uniref:protein DOG1-like 1 n=1 Tax=Apium graveolens TaxID=4045 RepID=UPI003D79FFED